MFSVTDFEKKRAENQIWTAAERYDFKPDYTAYKRDGSAEIYWNYIFGATRKLYDYDKFAAILHSFSAYEESFLYESLFWLGMENAVFFKCVGDRPALAELRHDYGECLIRETSISDDFRLYDALARAHFQRALGREVTLNQYDITLLNELEFSPGMSTDDIIQKTEEIFKHWFRIVLEEGNNKKSTFFPGFNRKNLSGKKRKKESKGKYRKFGTGFAARMQNSYGGEDTGNSLSNRPIATKLTDAELRQFMESKFGKSIYEAEEVKQIEKQLCHDNHKNCHLLFTDGSAAAFQVNNGFEALQREKEMVQREKNRHSYQSQNARNKLIISKLRERLQNSILMYLQPSPVKNDSGILNGSLVWRAIELDDPKVFYKTEQDNCGELSVDILLDASTSQKGRQESVSAQAYIIAEALTQCRIPCRVMSFCSMTGYTILKIFREYDRPEHNVRIFDYVANGCNRDGLAIRAAHYLASKSSYEHKILIILSDVKPNDVVRIETGFEQNFTSYEGDAGIRDTATEVRSARGDHMSVICVFTGTDDDINSARLVYGRDLARIRSMDRLADAVGTLLQMQIRNL